MLGDQKVSLIERQNPSLWKRTKHYFNTDSVSFNGYDLVAPLWQTASTFGVFIYASWVYDNCPIDAAHRSNFDYYRVVGLETGVSVFVYFFNLACRYIKKHYQLQPLQSHLNNIVASSRRNNEVQEEDSDGYQDGADYDWETFEADARLHRFKMLVSLDRSRHHVFSGMMSLACSLSFYAVATIQNNKDLGYWGGCRELDVVKVFFCGVAFVSGFLSDYPLENKRLELEGKIQLLT